MTWALPLSGSDSGTITVALGWDSAGPTATVGLADFKLGDGALSITAIGGYAAGSIAVSAALGVHLQNAIGIDVTPTLSFTESGGTFQLELYPLASGCGTSHRPDHHRLHSSSASHGRRRARGADREVAHAAGRQHATGHRRDQEHVLDAPFGRAAPPCRMC